LTVYTCAAVIVSALISLLFYLFTRRRGPCKKSLIAAVTVLNILFCVAVPWLFYFFGGDDGSGAPALGLPAVLLILLALFVVYVAAVVWGVVLRAPGLRLNAPLPEADAGGGRYGAPLPEADVGSYSPHLAEPAPAGGFSSKNTQIQDDIATQTGENADFIKNSVDRAKKLDKMIMSGDFHQDTDNSDVISLINSAFDCLGGGKLEEAAEYFYCAIEKRPPLSLEIKIATQLSMVYSELGRTELSSDILSEYGKHYQDQLDDEDRAVLLAGVGINESMVAGIGGDGNEKN